MRKAIVTVLANDRPGILAAVSAAIFENNGNLEHVSQTILEHEFAGLFIVTLPEGLTEEALAQRMQETLSPIGMDVQVKPLDPETRKAASVPSEPFVITCFGPDRQGLVAEITRILARHNVNVTNLRAVFEGGDDPSRNLMIYEAEIPETTDPAMLSEELRQKASDLALEINIQHRNIFQSITRL